MKTISTTECQRPDAVSVSPGDHPELMWLSVVDLVLEPGYQHRLEGAGKAIVDRIARRFSWACFLAVVVTPREDGKFTVIDGHRRTAAATAPSRRRAARTAAPRATAGTAGPASRPPRGTGPPG